CGPQSAARGGVAIGDILKKGFGVDGPTTLPVEHRQDAFDASVQVHGAGVSAVEAVDRTLDGERLKAATLRPILPALECPHGWFGKPGFWASILPELGPQVPLDTCMKRRADHAGFLLFSVGGLNSCDGFCDSG